MISSLWIAKTGLDAQQTNMDVIANNLANVSTNGFKRQRAVFGKAFEVPRHRLNAPKIEFRDRIVV